jgi:hypothetical protein
VQLKRLFHLLVIGGATLATGACGSSSTNDSGQQNNDAGDQQNPDGGGNPDAGQRNPDGGPKMW